MSELNGRINNKNLNMDAPYITCPVRLSKPEMEVEDFSGEQEYHAPYLHENCRQCEDALLEELNKGRWGYEPDLLSKLNEAYFKEEDIKPFRVYRHFHPKYLFTYNPYQRIFSPVALPRQRFINNPGLGDIVLLRMVLSGKTYQAVITNPELYSYENISGYYSNSNKTGYYVQAYGNIGGPRNDTVNIRIADLRKSVADNVVILKKLFSATSSRKTDSAPPAPLQVISLQNEERPNLNEGGEYETDPTLETGTISCPSEVDEIVLGWGQYKDQIELLPPDEQDKIRKIADLIVTSFITPGCTPLGQITVIGHADHDFHGAAFEKKVSDERAQSVAAAVSTAIIKGFKAHKIDRIARGAIAFIPTPTGVGAIQPDPINVPHVIDRTRNRRVEILVRHRGAPIPPPDTFDARIERFLRLLATNRVNPDPSGKRTIRARCILSKIRRPGFVDVFVDGTAANQIVGPHKVSGNLCSFQGKYDPPSLSDNHFLKFLGRVSPVLNGPGFGPQIPDNKILAGLSGLIFMINEGIIRVERYITLNSSDFGYVGDKTRGTRLSSIFADHLNDENSIYSCYTDFKGNE